MKEKAIHHDATSQRTSLFFTYDYSIFFYLNLILIFIIRLLLLQFNRGKPTIYRSTNDIGNTHTHTRRNFGFFSFCFCKSCSRLLRCYSFVFLELNHWAMKIIVHMNRYSRETFKKIIMMISIWTKVKKGYPKTEKKQKIWNNYLLWNNLVFVNIYIYAQRRKISN